MTNVFRSRKITAVHQPWCGYWYKQAVGATPVSTCTMHKVGDSRAYVGMNIDSGRLVKLGLGPLSRMSTVDNSPDITLESHYCYGMCLDSNAGIAYMGINSTDWMAYSLYISKVDITTMTVLDTLELSTSDHHNIQSMCDHPTTTGLFYVTIVDNNNPWTQTIYEIRTSDFTVTRSTTFRGAIHQANSLYVDENRGYIYYMGVRAAYEGKAYKFDLNLFADTADELQVADPLLTGSRQTGQAYDKCNGLFYTAYASTGPAFAWANYSIAEIDVDAFTVLRTVELPTLASGKALIPYKMDISDNRIFACAEDGDTSVFHYKHIATVDRTGMTFLQDMELTAIDGSYPTEVGDVGVLRDDDLLVLYCHGQDGSANDVAIYREYDISSGLPVDTTQVVYIDSTYVEIGDEASTLIVSQEYTL